MNINIQTQQITLLNNTIGLTLGIVLFFLLLISSVPAFSDDGIKIGTEQFKQLKALCKDKKLYKKYKKECRAVKKRWRKLTDEKQREYYYLIADTTPEKESKKLAEKKAYNESLAESSKNLTISKLKLGMTKNEVEGLLKNQNRTKNSNGSLWSKNDNKDEIEVLYGDNKLVYVVRNVSFGSKNNPSTKIIKSKIIEKYGEPQNKNSNPVGGGRGEDCWGSCSHRNAFRSLDSYSITNNQVISTDFVSELKLPKLNGNILTIYIGTIRDDYVERMEYTLWDLTYITKQSERINEKTKKSNANVDI